MVGTQLSVAIESDVAEHWAGFLVLDDESRGLGTLSYRGINGLDSVYAGAGEGAGIYRIFNWRREPDLANKHIQGFDFYNGFLGWDVGQWFVVDYAAAEVGDLSFSFFWQEDVGPPPFDLGLISSIRFQQVPTRDFNLDHRVDFRDFALLASYWPEIDDVDPNGLEGVDLDNSGRIDVSDIMLFSQYWLARTKGAQDALAE